MAKKLFCKGSQRIRKVLNSKLQPIDWLKNSIFLRLNDYNTEVQFEIVMGTSEQANIPVEGLFLNADAEF